MTNNAVCLKVHFCLIIIWLSNSLFNCIWQECIFLSSFNLSVLTNVFCENIIVLKLFWFFPVWLLFWKSLLDCAAAAAAKSLQSCPTLCDPRDGSPPGSPRPWDSPGKNTGVGCHFLLQCMKVKSESEVAQSCPTQWPHGLQPTRLLRPWDFPGKSTGVGCNYIGDMKNCQI